MSTTSTSPDSTAAAAKEGFQPIAAHGLIADCNSAALVDDHGSISWLCLPRYDSPAVFARILDPDGGHWSITPTEPYRTERRYLPGTLVLETTFTTESGSVKLTDAMAFAEGQRDHELGMGAPHLVLRSVEGLVGEVELALELAPRPEYGLVKPLFRETETRRTDVRRAQPDRRQLRRADLDRGLDDAREVHRQGIARGSGSRCNGRRRRARHRSRFPAERVAERIEDTVAGWRSWEDEHDIYEGPHRELVRLSARVLKGLTYRPTGAIVAAPTTSLARDGRRGAQLGLPLLVDPRREPDDRSAVHRGVLGRGGGVRLVHDQLGRAVVRASARCRSCTGSAASTT